MPPTDDTDDTTPEPGEPPKPMTTEPAGRPSMLRRYGPIAAVLVVLALVAAGAVVFRGDDETGTGAEIPEYTGELPDGVVTWSRAQEEDLDVEFPDTCDTEAGMVAVPFFFRTECVANVDDNGGETSAGVTGDEIKIVLWLPQADDPIYGFIRQALGFDDDVDDIRATQEGLIEIFQRYYQTYGRTVKAEFFQASGNILDPVVAQADAIEVADMEPFAVLGGPLIQGDWTQELADRGIVCVFCPGASGTAPYAFSLLPRPKQIRQHTAEYVSRKLAGKPAQYGGDELADQERVFGYLKVGIGDTGREQADELGEMLGEHGVDLATKIVYPFDPTAIQENATNIVAEMREEGVTTILVDGDPVSLPAITEEATKQRWFPEWVLTGPLLSDTSTFGRTMNQEQWRHAFGFSWLPPASVPSAVPAYQLYEWYFGEPPPADESLLLTYPQIAVFFTGVSFAGPNLTAETFRDGLFAWPPTQRAVTQPRFDYGTGIWEGYDDYWGIDDMVELWWDADAEGQDETGAEGRGLYRYVDGGRRYLPDEWTEELRVFDAEGAPTHITEPPPDEVPPDYPPPR